MAPVALDSPIKAPVPVALEQRKPHDQPTRFPNQWLMTLEQWSENPLILISTWTARHQAVSIKWRRFPWRDTESHRTLPRTLSPFHWGSHQTDESGDLQWRGYERLSVYFNFYQEYGSRHGSCVSWLADITVLDSQFANDWVLDRRAPFTYDAWNHPEVLAKISEVVGIGLIPSIDLDIANINIS